MPQKVKETKHTVEDNGLQTIRRIMQVLFAIVLFLLVFRLAFKLLGANASNVFVNLIYATTAPLVGLFEGIFPEMTVENNALAVFEPATVIAIIVTAVVAYIILKLLSVKQDKRTEYVEVQEQMNAVPLGQVAEPRMTQSTETPMPYATDRPMTHDSERPGTHDSERPRTHASETREQREKARLEKKSQELEERIRHQEQILEDQKKMYSSTQDEKESQELEEKIRHQEQILEDQRNIYNAQKDNESQELEDRIDHQQQILEGQQTMDDDAVHDEDELDEYPNNLNEIPVYEKRRRQN